jgi:hypothetical protein
MILDGLIEASRWSRMLPLLRQHHPCAIGHPKLLHHQQGIYVTFVNTEHNQR